MSNFLGLLAKARVDARDKSAREEAQRDAQRFAAIKFGQQQDLTESQIAENNARTEALLNPHVNWQTREGEDGFYQANPQTGETRKLPDIPPKTKTPPFRKSVDENGYVSLIFPDGSTKPVMDKNGNQRRERQPGSGRSTGVAPAPIRTVERQITDTRADIKRTTPKPLGPLSTSADSASFRSNTQKLGPLKQRLDSLSAVRDNMAAEQQGHQTASDPTAAMSDADAWEYWRDHGLTPSAATAKVNARRGRK